MPLGQTQLDQRVALQIDLCASETDHLLDQLGFAVDANIGEHKRLFWFKAEDTHPRVYGL